MNRISKYNNNFGYDPRDDWGLFNPAKSLFTKNESMFKPEYKPTLPDMSGLGVWKPLECRLIIFTLGFVVGSIFMSKFYFNFWAMFT